MNPKQVTPTPFYSFNGYMFFKHIFAKEAWDVDKNVDLFFSYLSCNSRSRKDIDGFNIWTGVEFDDNMVLFKDDAKKHQYKYYLFPIRRIDAYTRMNRLAFEINEQVDKYKLTMKYEPRKPFSDTYDVSEEVVIKIRDEAIPIWKRKLKERLIRMRSKSIQWMNKILPNSLRIIQSRKRFMFDYKYTLWCNGRK